MEHVFDGKSGASPEIMMLKTYLDKFKILNCLYSLLLVNYGCSVDAYVADYVGETYIMLL